jgi:ribonuclease P protein component
MTGIAGLITKFSQKEVDQLFQKSHRIFYDPQLTLLAAPREKAYARILIITQKAIGNAVARHLLRRRIKHIFYQEKLFEQLKYDIIVITKKPLLLLNFQELKDFFLKAVGIIR